MFKFEKIFFITIILFLPSVSVLAADIRITSESQNLRAGDQFTADILLNADQNVNALEGEITYPADLLKVKEIKDGNSIINFWIDRPRVDTSGHVVFSGIAAAGFIGSRGKIFSLILEAEKDGVGTVAFKNTQVFKNDGSGTAVNPDISNFQASILPGNSNEKWVSRMERDYQPPESFAPQIARDPLLFDNQWFLVFSAEDKESGLDHYEIKEVRQRLLAWSSEWREAQSPYLLNDQKLRSYVYVRAIDKAGNIREERVSPANPLPWYEYYDNWLICGIIILLVLMVLAKKSLVKILKHTGIVKC